MASDVLTMIGTSSEAMADCALAFQIAGQKAAVAAERYENLVAECDKLGLPSHHYANIAATFREVQVQHRNYVEGLGDLVTMCMRLAEVCR